MADVFLEHNEHEIDAAVRQAHEHTNKPVIDGLTDTAGTLLYKGNPISGGGTGTDGREVEIQASATHIQWRYVGDTAWQNIVALADLKGDDGADGAPGTPGSPGTPGAAATITVGTVTTGAAGTAASVTNVGTSSAARFNFVIPRGDKGETGAQGNPGVGVPAGGTTGQVLAKASGANYDTQWVTQSGGGGGILPETITTGTPRVTTIYGSIYPTQEGKYVISRQGNWVFATMVWRTTSDPNTSISERPVCVQEFINNSVAPVHPEYVFWYGGTYSGMYMTVPVTQYSGIVLDQGYTNIVGVIYPTNVGYYQINLEQIGAGLPMIPLLGKAFTYSSTIGMSFTYLTYDKEG